MDDTYFLNIYILATLGLAITSIVQCWLANQKNIKKIIWTVVIVASWPFFILGTIVFGLLHYRGWRKALPFTIVIVLASGAYFQLIKWEENISEKIVEIQKQEAVFYGIEEDFISRESKPILYDWAEATLLELLNLQPESYLVTLEDNKTFFTADGYSSYYKAIERAGIIDGLNNNTFDLIFAIYKDKQTKAYSLNQHNLGAGWIVKVPGNLTYRHVEKPRTMNVTVSLLVKKELEGLKAVQVVVTPDQI